MEILRAYVRQIKRSRNVFIVVGFVVVAILIGAYIDLKAVSPLLILEDEMIAGVSTSTVANPIVVPANVLRYENKKYSFAFEYPNILDISESQHKATNDYDGIVTDSLFVGSFPENYGTGTNLTSASIIAGVRNVKEQVCHGTLSGNNVATIPGRIPPLKVTIGDIEYTVVSVNDAGAGNLYTTTRYTAMHGGRCYSVSIVAHSFNDIETYNEDHPTAPVVIYDQDKIDSVLDRVMQSFTFTDQV